MILFSVDLRKDGLFGIHRKILKVLLNNHPLNLIIEVVRNVVSIYQSWRLKINKIGEVGNSE